MYICSNGLLLIWHQAIICVISGGITRREINSSSIEQNGRHFADDIFKCIFMNEKLRILIKISLKFVPKCLIDNKPMFVQVMSWRQSGDKPSTEQMLTQFAATYMWL